MDPFSERFLSMAQGQYTLRESLFLWGLRLINWMVLVLQTSVLLSPLLTTVAVPSIWMVVVIHLAVAPNSSLDFALSPILASPPRLTRQVLLLCM